VHRSFLKILFQNVVYFSPVGAPIFVSSNPPNGRNQTMYDYALLGTHALLRQPNANNGNRDVLDRPEWESFVPLFAMMAAWSTARRKAALAGTKCKEITLPAALMRPATRPAC
jgi:hypothetical protein